MSIVFIMGIVYIMMSVVFKMTVSSAVVGAYCHKLCIAGRAGGHDRRRQCTGRQCCLSPISDRSSLWTGSCGRWRRILTPYARCPPQSTPQSIDIVSEENVDTVCVVRSSINQYLKQSTPQSTPQAIEASINRYLNQHLSQLTLSGRGTSTPSVGCSRSDMQYIVGTVLFSKKL